MRIKQVVVTASFVTLSVLFFNSHFVSAKPFSGRTIQLPLQKIAPGSGQIVIDFTLPENHEFALEAPASLWTRIKNPQLLQVLPFQAKPVPLDLSKLPHTIRYEAIAGQTIFVTDARIHFCNKDVKICLTEWIRIKFPVEISSGNPSLINLKIPVGSQVIVWPKKTSATK